MFSTVVYLILAIILQNAAAVSVRVEQGKLRGEQKWTITGDKLYNSFKGIPYAAPPIGKFRFKAPQPAPYWKGIRNATEYGNVCPQYDVLRSALTPGSEDCLFMNVYTTCMNPSSLLPVLVVVHGGKFIWGSGNDDIYGPDFIVDSSDIVMVTFNYRIDHLGFLSLDTAEAPGNAGMKDQIAALRWVKRNIKNFGGDPNRVTIMGESSGAMSVTYLALSPMSQGLFQRVISMSGVAISEFTVAFEPQRRAFALAKSLGFVTTNTTELFEFLQSVPAVDLINTNTPIVAAEDYIIPVKMLYSWPVVEKDFGQERFLIEPPDVSVRKGRSNVDMFLGFTSGEGVFFIPEIEEFPVIENFDRYPEVLTPKDILYRSMSELHLKLADYIKEYYTGSKRMSLNTVPQVVEFVSHSFIYSIISYANLLSNYSPNDNIYMYEFTGMSERNKFSQLGTKYGITGVSHFDDIMYVFNANLFNFPLNKNATSYKMIRQMCSLLTNFAMHGNPTPDASLGVTWPKYNKNSREYIEIGEDLTLSANPRQTMVDFYDFIYEVAGTKKLY
ncbi:jg12247 [Pararge aegeria aegeria]|uniref:Carboxylic ester hydrolase n=1 Tax=Pararge aegeria aegeria TaxID=348720 RepID=A0A8S4S2Y3_9NEOP|nr:jg12247 [Pararge aegeria aegeria]